jgi:hypothetical protein
VLAIIVVLFNAFRPPPVIVLIISFAVVGITFGFAPVVLVVLANLVTVKVLIPALDTAYLAEPLFGSTTVEALRGLWAIVIALTVSIVFVAAPSWRRLASLQRSIDSGANASVLPIFNTASLWRSTSLPA